MNLNLSIKQEEYCKVFSHSVEFHSNTCGREIQWSAALQKITADGGPSSAVELPHSLLAMLA